MKKKYSHIDLLHMIDGVEMQKATVVAGNRCYYLKVGHEQNEVNAPHPPFVVWKHGSHLFLR